MTRVFDCNECGTFGKVIIKGSDLNNSDIVFCPCCGADINEEEFDEEE
jgi:hypothetical protein